jgi:lysophospholipase L1-like esterase
MPAPYVNYRLQPDYLKVEHGRDFTIHNARGFREPFPIGEKKSGMLRIVCLGGSTTYGSGVKDNGQTYPAQLNRIFSHDAAFRIEGYRQCEVLNLGVGGYTSAEVLPHLHFFALPLKPDMVLIQCAINDVAPRLYDRFDFSYEHFRKPMEPLQPGWLARQCYRSRLVILSGWLLGRFKPLTLQARTQLPLPSADRREENFRRNGPKAYRRNLEASITLARAAGCRVWLLTQAYFEPPIPFP